MGSFRDAPVYTLKDRKMAELAKRLGREPTKREFLVKEAAEEEAVETIDATPSRQYVPDEVVQPHYDALEEKLGGKPTEDDKELFEAIFTDEVEDANVNREMRM